MCMRARERESMSIFMEYCVNIFAACCCFILYNCWDWPLPAVNFDMILQFRTLREMQHTLSHAATPTCYTLPAHWQRLGKYIKLLLTSQETHAQGKRGSKRQGETVAVTDWRLLSHCIKCNWFQRPRALLHATVLPSVLPCAALLCSTRLNSTRHVRSEYL